MWLTGSRHFVEKHVFSVVLLRAVARVWVKYLAKTRQSISSRKSASCPATVLVGDISSRGSSFYFLFSAAVFFHQFGEMVLVCCNVQ